MRLWLFVVAGLFVGYALISRRLSTTIITGPMVFVTAGLLIGPDVVGALDVQPNAEAVTLLLEVTLAVVLYSDATTINGSAWRKEAFIPGRLLLVDWRLPWRRTDVPVTEYLWLHTAH